ncbi:ABC transporter ATP-binding protein [Rhodophyticola sp. CCM32]|uniref:ABC transporter ATP-binding protein n=1 Tax=Rhodophyticola sp. CCM32 TaxID=2916397 RepID=UPI00107F9766|nr:ATP-binding cassette domain-containing protein [Rhodophyticola sp. CCM32]QBY01272.1 ABC transporter ATP-binding protein [Rhodophyticola sp. CCM32]
MAPVLDCDGLTITYPSGETPVRDVSFQVHPGECFALVGGSGAGKSTIAKALIGLHRKGTRVTGALRLNGHDMTTADRPTWQAARGRQVGFIAQNPWAACDPLRTVRDHVAEAWRSHGLAPDWHDIARRLEGLGVDQASGRMGQHPHTWSGGMLQRASITAAAALDCPLIIADEPTSALDADRAQAVMDALRALGRAVVLISHDVELVLRNADRISVLHDGRLVETGTSETLRRAPVHAETRRLLSVLAPFPARPAIPCPASILRLSNVAVRYTQGRINALSGVSLEIAAGEIVGLQGPSGCGKSTLLRLVMGLEKPTSGEIFRRPELSNPAAVLPIFQDPVASLVPHWPIWRSVAEPLTAPHRPRIARAVARDQAQAALASVGLERIDPEARPAELSIGQCQRAAIARAMIARPALITADEPTSALDGPSTHKIGLLLREAAKAGTAVLMVSHDHGLLSRLADRIVAMTQGRTPPAPINDARASLGADRQ